MNKQTRVGMPWNRIVWQQLLPDGILTTFENGEKKLLPYLIDEHGQEYADIDPNREILSCCEMN